MPFNQRQVLPEPHLVGSKSADVVSQLAGDQWSFIYLANSQGPQVAKDAFLTTVTTVGVIDALMLSFVVPSLSSIPNSLSYDPDDPNLETRLWFWFSFLSVVLSIASLILATIMLTYMTPVPARGVLEYLKFIHLPFSLCAGTFIFSVLLQGAAQLSVIHSYISTKDFWIAVAILLSVYFALIAFFLVTDSRSGRSNLKLYKLWVEERGEKENGRGDEQQIVA